MQRHPTSHLKIFLILRALHRLMGFSKLPTTLKKINLKEICSNRDRLAKGEISGGKVKKKKKLRRQ
jgi:hypothetical protein